MCFWVKSSCDSAGHICALIFFIFSHILDRKSTVLLFTFLSTATNMQRDTSDASFTVFCCSVSSREPVLILL